jgi:hypothetical protein
LIDAKDGDKVFESQLLDYKHNLFRVMAQNTKARALDTERFSSEMKMIVQFDGVRAKNTANMQ